MTTVVTLILFAVALPALAASLYLLLFTLLSGTPRAPLRSTRLMRFDVIPGA